MRLIILILLTLTLSHAKERISLAKILDHLEDKAPQFKILLQKKKAFEAEYESLRSSNYLSLTTTAAYAQPEFDEAQAEFSLGLQKKWQFPHTKKGKAQSKKLNNEAKLLRYKKSLLSLKNRVRFLYHKACLDQTIANSYEKNHQLFNTLVHKKKRSFEFGESSKKELLQFKIESIQMQQKLHNYLSLANFSKQKLQEIAFLPEPDKTSLLCSDMIAIKDYHLSAKKEASLMQRSLQNNVLGAKSLASAYDTNLESIQLNLNYEEEFDTKRFRFGLSIPLAFTSSYNEDKRAQALSNLQAFKYEKVLLTKQRNAQIIQLQSKLSRQYLSVQSLLKGLNLYQKELLPLIEKSYQLGESSLVEFLLNKRELWNMRNALLESQKSYYKTLFEIYTTTESKDQL